ncbi:Tryp_SPc [Chamberlinius hualienensis]
MLMSIQCLLSTFATSSTSPDCSGDCRHMLSALFCTYVDENASCGDPQLRCCTNPPPVPPPLIRPPSEINQLNNLTKPESDKWPESTSSSHTTTIISAPANQELSNKTVSSLNVINVSSNAATSNARPDKRPPHLSTSKGNQTAHRQPILGVGSAISVGTNLTVRPGGQRRRPGQRRRTTTSKPFSTTSKPVITSTVREIVDANLSAFENAENKTETVMKIPIAEALVGESSINRPIDSNSQPCNGICISRMVAALCSETYEVSTKVPARHPSDDGVAECRGSCVMGLLSMLCDAIDESVTCENGGQCCISKHDEENMDSVATTTAPKEKMPPELTNCPGICLPVLLSGVCNRPAVLLPKTKDCESGKICCDNSLREAPTTTTTTASPLLGLLSWPLKLAAGGILGGDSSNGNSGSSGGSDLASSATALLVPALANLLSGSGSKPQTTPVPQIASHKHGAPLERPMVGPFNNGGGNGGNMPQFHRPPHHQPQPPHSPQLPVQQQSVFKMPSLALDQPTCTGTCIASFLRTTCFGQSHIAEDLLCPKQNLVCCVQKSTPVTPSFQSEPSNINNWNTTFTNNFPNNAPNIHFSPFTNRPTNKYVCGMKGPVRPETPRVVGGRDASPGEWCWQVALINSLNQYLCGGALIGRQWVLTAAHCVTTLIQSGNPIYIRVGDYDLTSKYGSPGAQTLKVATTYIHHNHNSQTLDNNIALLKLEKEAELKEGVCLVCLPARGVSVENGKSCVVTGYGYMGESGPIPLRVRSATLPIVGEQECVRKINSVTDKVFILPASSFCAGGEEGHDACQGDGGGPLSCEVDGYYEITGLVSWGFGCGRADVPGIYVKISSFIGWINQIISVNV